MTQKDLEVLNFNANNEYRKEQYEATKEFYRRRDALIAPDEQAQKEHTEKVDANMRRQQELEAELAEKRRYGIATYSVEWQVIKQQLDEVCSQNRHLKDEKSTRKANIKASLRKIHQEYEAECIQRRIKLTEKKKENTRLYIEAKAQAEANA